MNCFKTLSFVMLSAVGLLMDRPMADAQDSGPREVREVASGWQFQVNVRDVGEREHWYDADFDRSGWRGRAAQGVGPLRRGHAGL